MMGNLLIASSKVSMQRVFRSQNGVGFRLRVGRAFIPRAPSFARASASHLKVAGHAQAIIVAIDQYAEAVTGNRDYFLDKPYRVGGARRTGDVPCGKRASAGGRTRL